MILVAAFGRCAGGDRGEIVKHLTTYGDSGPDALVFTGPKGRAPPRAHFKQHHPLGRTIRTIGVPGLHFRDLRHSGNHFAARTGASTADLTARMGHDDMRAALIYQRATSADRRIADRMSELVSGAATAGDDEGDAEHAASGALLPVRLAH